MKGIDHSYYYEGLCGVQGGRTVAMSCSNYYRTVKLFLLEDPGKSRVYDYTESVPVHIYQEDCRISLDELFR